MTIGTVIRRWRIERGITQQQMEKATGIEQRYISALELDKIKEPGPFKLHAILRVLDKSLDELVELCQDDEAARLLPVAA